MPPPTHARARTQSHPGQATGAPAQPRRRGRVVPERSGAAPSPWHPSSRCSRERGCLEGGSIGPGPHSHRSQSQTSCPQGSIYGRDLWQLSLLWMENLSNYYEVKAFRKSGRAGRDAQLFTAERRGCPEFRRPASVARVVEGAGAAPSSGAAPLALLLAPELHVPVRPQVAKGSGSGDARHDHPGPRDPASPGLPGRNRGTRPWKSRGPEVQGAQARQGVQRA